MQYFSTRSYGMQIQTPEYNRETLEMMSSGILMDQYIQNHLKRQGGLRVGGTFILLDIPREKQDYN